MNENQNEYVDINAHDNYPDSDQKIEIPTMKVIPLKKICMTIGELPTSYLETMTYYEMLIWFIEYLKNNIIPTINNNASAVQEVQSVVLELQNYINHYKDSIDSDVEELEEYMNNYFENLDVQEEINNKLDQMLEQGTLQEIIEQFIQTNALWTFDSVEDMKSATNLINGSYARTLGYYSINDGGGSIYKITNSQSVSEYQEELNSGLYATLIKLNNCINLTQIGAKGNGVDDDSDFIITALQYFDNIDGNNKTYYVTKEFTVNNKILKNITLKAEPFEVVDTTIKDYYYVYTLTGNNELTNMKVISEFKYLPSVNVRTGETSDTGISSNVIAFTVSSGNTNFYNCKSEYCRPFNIVADSNANIYNALCNNCDMSLFISSTGNVKVYDSQFIINKAVDSTYYHHIYQTQRTHSEFNNCSFTEVGTGEIGNQLHGNSTSLTPDYEIEGEMILNNCTLITSAWAGQLNCINLYVNGGKIESRLLLVSDDKPLSTFKNVDITCTLETGNYPITQGNTIYQNCNINIESTGTMKLSKIGYKIYDSIINCLKGTFDNRTDATSENPCTTEIVVNNCIINAKNVGWCYPTYANDVKINSTTFNLTDTKATTNPADRSTTGYLFNCIFNNWDTPLNHGASNTLMYEYISDTTHRNISA